MRFLVSIALAVALIAVAFNFAKPLPDRFTEDSFLPKASSVKYLAAGNDASFAGLLWIKGLTSLGESFLSGKEYNYLSHVANLCTELDSLFYTPYYFVSSVTPSDTRDTTDFIVMRFRLFSSLKMLSCENFEIPVMNTKRRNSSQSFNGAKKARRAMRISSSRSGLCITLSNGASYSSISTTTGLWYLS